MECGFVSFKVKSIFDITFLYCLKFEMNSNKIQATIELFEN